MSTNAINTIRQMPDRLERLEPQEAGPQVNVSLQPIAAPSILGLYGFAGATFIVAAHMAHWFGTSQTDMVLWPFAAFFGGLAQFLAGMWSFKARDGVATAMHGMWGSFWMAFGVLWLLGRLWRQLESWRARKACGLSPATCSLSPPLSRGMQLQR